MDPHMKQIYFWTPRVMSILVILFVSVFALDVFGAAYTFWQTVLALVMHLIPTFLLLIVLAIAWRWEAVGGLLFIGLGLTYIILSWPNLNQWTALFSGLAFVIGILFWVAWKEKARTSSV